MTFSFHCGNNTRISTSRKSPPSARPPPPPPPPPTHQTSQESHGEDDEQPQQQHQIVETYPTIMDLPIHLFIEILSRLPLKSILFSRCVSKTWRILISDPEFARLQFNRANVELFIRNYYPTCSSRTLHWVDSEIIPSNADNYRNRRKTKINAPFYLPKCFPKLEHKKTYEEATEPEYRIVNSCYGFLYLCDPCIVWNPVTGEYITIPKPRKDENMVKTVISGFGYSLKSNRYKVVRFMDFEDLSHRVAEVYTIGSSSWLRVGIGYAPSMTVVELSATYLNGVIHWVCADETDDHSSDFIMAFDFDNERFRVVPAPPHFGEEHKNVEILGNMNMGVLGGCLSICDFNHRNHFDIWVMKDYGVQESWIIQFAIDNFCPKPCKPMKYLSNGDVLMFYKGRALAIYNPVLKKFRYLPLQEARSIIFEAIAHTPSFLSLKDAIGGDSLKVKNAISGCVKSKLQEESETLFLVESKQPGELLSLLGFFVTSRKK